MKSVWRNSWNVLIGKTIQSEILNFVTLNELEELKYGSMEWLHTVFTWYHCHVEKLKQMLR